MEVGKQSSRVWMIFIPKFFMLSLMGQRKVLSEEEQNKLVQYVSLWKEERHPLRFGLTQKQLINVIRRIFALDLTRISHKPYGKMAYLFAHLGREVLLSNKHTVAFEPRVCEKFR